MKKNWLAGAVVGLVLSLPAFAVAQGAAKKPAKAPRLPAAVSEAFKKAYPDATIRSTSREMEDGKTVYEVESVDKGMNRDLLYAADGTVLECEEQVKPDELPAPVADALKSLYPKATITKAERTTKGRALRYDLTVKGATVREVSFTPDGKPAGAGPKT